MTIRIENGKIIFTDIDKEYSFDAHGDTPRPSIMPSIIVVGKHLSSRSSDEKIEKYTAVQDVTIGNGMAAWYVQEFIPDGLDYKIGKKSAIYIGLFASGEEHLIYYGECYGDLCFDGNDLYFNIGNKVAVYHLLTKTTEILFKHSGIKKSDLELHITPKRIFFQHWTHSSNSTMWYDRETGEVVNPHFDGRPMFLLDDETIIYGGIEHVWKYDVAAMKKKRFFNNKTEDSIFQKIAAFFGVPEIYCNRYHSMFASIRLEDYKDRKLYFKCSCHYTSGEISSEEELRECHSLGLPMSLHTFVTCNIFGDEIMIAADPQMIVRKEEPFTKYYTNLDFPDVSLWTYQNNC